MNNKIISAVLVATVLLSGLVSFADISVKKEAGYISLSGSKTKEVEPNMAKITFAVENTASDAQKAASENNNISNKIITALKAITDPKTDIIKTSNFSVSPIYNTTATGKREIKNYSAINSVTVQTKDIQKVSKLIDTAIANGANRTDNLFYTFENDRSICNELYPEIIKEIRTEAQTIVSAAGASIDGVKHLNASCNTDFVASNGRFFAAKAAMDGAVEDAGANSTPVESGKVKIRVYVNVDFYLK